MSGDLIGGTQPETACYSPRQKPMKERLQERLKGLEQQETEVREAIRLLELNPDVNSLLDVLQRIGV